MIKKKTKNYLLIVLVVYLKNIMKLRTKIYIINSFFGEYFLLFVNVKIKSVILYCFITIYHLKERHFCSMRIIHLGTNNLITVERIWWEKHYWRMTNGVKVQYSGYYWMKIYLIIPTYIVKLSQFGKWNKTESNYL